MRRALELAEMAASEGEVPVGCVVTWGNEIVGEGYNRREGDKNALRHAELIAIERACEALDGWRLHGCEMFVTLEPCPMCAGAAINARISRVVFAALDPKAGALISRVMLFDHGFNHKPEVMYGLMERESAILLGEFFLNLRK
jgi:tRNA(adenine34) deaminase